MRYCAVLLVASWVLPAQTESEWLNRGVQAFKNANYGEAVEAFGRAVELNPGGVTARLYLGAAHMQQYIPGAEAPENVAHADRATAEFQRVLDLAPGNQVALASIASLELNRKRFAEARDWHRRLLVITPADKTAYYSMGFPVWAEWYPAYAAARAKIGMRPETPGPIPDAAVRDTLRAQWWSAIDEGMLALKRALDLDPEFADAMAYLNLFIRERADLLGGKQEYDQEIAEADRWVQRALDAKKRQAAAVQGGLTPPPPRPPGSGLAAVAHRVIVGSAQAGKLVAKVDPVYPDAARAARIQGVVKFSAVIDKDGRVTNLQVNSGHPLLVPAAIEAVRQWRYQPNVLNGEAVEVRTDIDVNFTLGN